MQIFVGVMLGVTTSLAAGLFLIWKGETLVNSMRFLPTRRKIKIIRQAYLRAVGSYPDPYSHQLILMLWALAVLFFGILFLCTSFVMIHKIGASAPPSTSAELKSFVESHEIVIWLVVALAGIFNAWVGAKTLFYEAYVEATAPKAYAVLARIRECVARCGTKKEFLEYVDAENHVRDIAGLKALLERAQRVFGDLDLALLDDLLPIFTVDPSLLTSGDNASDD